MKSWLILLCPVSMSPLIWKTWLYNLVPEDKMPRLFPCSSRAVTHMPASPQEDSARAQLHHTHFRSLVLSTTSGTLLELPKHLQLSQPLSWDSHIYQFTNWGKQWFFWCSTGKKRKKDDSSSHDSKPESPNFILFTNIDLLIYFATAYLFTGPRAADTPLKKMTKLSC